VATAFLIREGFEVYRAQASQSSADLIAWRRDTAFLAVDVKLTKLNTDTRNGVTYEARRPLAKKKTQRGIIPLHVYRDGRVVFDY
jgi:Holliday junction resolvase